MSEFIQDLINHQKDFEQARVGTDGSLWDHNDVLFLLIRGLVGETVEIHDAYVYGDREDLKGELADVLIFYAAVLAHTDFSGDEIREAVETKLEINRRKYDPSHFADRTVREGIAYSRSVAKTKKGTQVE